MILNTADLLIPSTKHYIINDRGFQVNKDVLKSITEYLFRLTF